MTIFSFRVAFSPACMSLCPLYSYKGLFALSLTSILKKIFQNKKKKKRKKISLFCTSLILHLFSKREQADGWCVSEAGFVQCLVTSRASGPVNEMNTCATRTFMKGDLISPIAHLRQIDQSSVTNWCRRASPPRVYASSDSLGCSTTGLSWILAWENEIYTLREEIKLQVESDLQRY